MQKVIRSYIFDGKSFEELQKALDEGYVVVMANKVGKCDDAIEYILEKKDKEVSIDVIVKGLREFAKRVFDNDDQSKWIKAGILEAAKMIETGEVR
jgi:hypothetical protein